MKIFKCDANLKSYTYPLKKLLICFVIVIVLLLRVKLLSIDNGIIAIFFNILSTFVFLGCVFCIYISIAEMIYVSENKEKENLIKLKKSGKSYSLDYIVSLVEANDIIKIFINNNNRITEIGSSSDCQNSNSHFFAKRYYIDKEEYLSIEDFKSKITSFANEGNINVISIDGITLK